MDIYAVGYLKFTPWVRDVRCSRSQFPFSVPRIIERTITQQILKYAQQTRRKYDERVQRKKETKERMRYRRILSA